MLSGRGVRKIDVVSPHPSHTFDFHLQVSIGRTFTTDRAKGYTHGIRVRLNSKESLAIYAKHPLHVSFKKAHILPLLDESKADPVCAMDFLSKRAAESRP